MWFEAGAGPAAEARATGLELAELVAMQPRHFRAPRAPGRRSPGGERAGRGRAQSLDFDGISPYQTGDDIRWIDWRATARSGQTQMRRFAAESHRARMVLVDLSPATYFGTRGRLMAKTAALVAARLCWESQAWQEPVGLVASSRSELLGPRRGKRHVLRLLALLREGYLAGLEEAPGPAVTDLLLEASAHLGAADELCLVGDFGELDETFKRLSGSLAGQRSLRAFLVEDPVFRGRVPAGRYPMRDALEREDRSAVIGTRHGATAAETESLRRLRQDRLRDLGWEVVDALDLLPRQGEPPS